MRAVHNAIGVSDCATFGVRRWFHCARNCPDAILRDPACIPPRDVCGIHSTRLALATAVQERPANEAKAGLQLLPTVESRAGEIGREE
jgi:hypothetical protein